ncbi:PREDICTED: centrosome-associated protein CEP250-like [Cyprinodon variegatus]|uniref:centrosome-associated protein CEP250-like n=1 Tax=Cyprinodon variegatus TaxID=28743 RepID=UPI0007426599|nr:PREDICTED: centrosome-associated protein CEP250-like [Cyprinodon variegatus]
MVSELEFNAILGSKDENISALQQENASLREEVMKLTQKIEMQQTNHEDEVAVLYDERIKTNKDRRDAIRKADQLKVFLITEKNKTKEAEICLAKQMEETSRLQAALAKMETDMEEQRQQWEQEKCCLLTSKSDPSAVEKLKYQLETQKVTHEEQVAALNHQLSKRNKDLQDAIKRAEQLEETLIKEKSQAKEAQDRFAQKNEATSRLQAALAKMERALAEQRLQWEKEKSQAALVKVQQDLENQRQLWIQEKSRLLTEQQKTVRDVEATMKDVQEVLHNERQQWQTATDNFQQKTVRKSCFLESLASTEESLKEMDEERKTSTESLVEELKQLQQEMDNFQEKPKKKS